MAAPNKNWTEFDWERELRNEDSRIHAYLNELPKFIDLPGEEELLMKCMQLKTELIPQNIDWSDSFINDIFDDVDFDDEIFFSEEWKKRKGANVYMLIERLAHQWNIIFSSVLKDELLGDGLKITSRYGKILARTADILDVATDEIPNLKIAVFKRLVSETNTLMGELHDLALKQKSISIRLETHISHLQTIREKMIDHMENLRNGASGKGKK